MKSRCSTDIGLQALTVFNPAELPTRYVRFQVLTVASMKCRVFSDVAPCSLIGVDRRFRCTYCLHYQGVSNLFSATMSRPVLTYELLSLDFFWSDQENYKNLVTIAACGRSLNLAPTVWVAVLGCETAPCDSKYWNIRLTDERYDVKRHFTLTGDALDEKGKGEETVIFRLYDRRLGSNWWASLAPKVTRWDRWSVT
jgi:hypothetical protein